MLFLAVRHLLSRKKQTVLILLGISLGTTMYVVISGMQLGMREFTLDRLLQNIAHIRISARDRVIDATEMTDRFFGPGAAVKWIIPPSGKREEAHIVYPQGWFDRLRDDPDVVAYAPGLTLNVIISRRQSKYPGTLAGIEPEKTMRVTAMEKYMTHGSLRDLIGGGNKLVVGEGVLDRLGVRVGDTIRVSTGIGETRPFKIVGTWKLGVKQVDEVLMMASLRDVQALNRTPGRINEINVKLADINDAQKIADQWELVARDNVESWSETNANFLQIFAIQDIVRYSVTAAILIVAGFGIYNVLSIMVTQKRHEIAILGSMGYPPRKILLLFMEQGLILGIGGALIGLPLGYALCQYVGSIEVNFTGVGTHLLVSYSPSIYLVGFLLAFISALLASYLPSHAASKMMPIDIIRSE
ncbi:MAG: ABC transporter permease [Acidiferrobacterales bacterium]